MTKPLNIAIAGLGTVGAATIDILEKGASPLAARTGRPFAITAVSARDANKKRDVDISRYRFEKDPLALATAKDVDVIVELMGGAEGSARALVEAALKSGKHVVTANKALIATHGAALAKTAEQNKLSLCFEAAVAGGIPILKTLREGLAANPISRVMGILNGTCNYILTNMWEGKRELADVLKEAQKLGYAEADPSFDVGGIDAAHKLAILTALAYGVAPDLSTLHIEGIEKITLRDMQFADELGYVIRLLGVTCKTKDGVLQRVHPCLVAKGSSLAHVRGVFNAVQVEAQNAGSIFMQGRGAGGQPTASAVIADLCDVARGHLSYPFGVSFSSLKTVAAAPLSALESAYYIRMGVVDKPGVLADITGVFKECGISLKSFIQHGENPGEKVYIVVATHTTREDDLQKALNMISKQGSVLEAPFSIRIEE